VATWAEAGWLWLSTSSLWQLLRIGRSCRASSAGFLKLPHQLKRQRPARAFISTIRLSS